MTDRERTDASEENRGPYGDARPDNTKVDPRTRGSRPQEKVEDRENVSTVAPDAYPAEDLAVSQPK